MNMSKTFLIGDTHFGLGDYFPEFQRTMHRWHPEHDREFKSADEMEQLIIRRWNSVVGENDTVISLGDFAWAGEYPEDYEIWMHSCDIYKIYLTKLNGNIVMIHGNHDPFNDGLKCQCGNILYYRGRTFYMVHDPGKRERGYEKIPENWVGWVIHGHHHWVPDYYDKTKTYYPFINGDKKAINVACDVIDYTPVSIDTILSFGIDSIKRMNTIVDDR